MVFGFVWLGFAIVTALAAAARNRSAAAWFFIGLLGGVFALLAVLVMRPGGDISAQIQSVPSWSPPATMPNRGTVIGLHKGSMIHQDEDLYWTEGRSFTSIEAARRHIDHQNS